MACPLSQVHEARRGLPVGTQEIEFSDPVSRIVPFPRDGFQPEMAWIAGMTPARKKQKTFLTRIMQIEAKTKITR